MDRPWSLSPVPVLLPGDEWAALAFGVSQRAHLLELLLADLYGPQRALTEGWLPPELVFNHPHFLRPVHGLRLPRGGWLPLYALDLVRAADGSWRALADRTQAPVGAGYALENRIVVSQVLPICSGPATSSVWPASSARTRRPWPPWPPSTATTRAPCC
jgi:uncharacterized circularly permuted ATP-grasp superfamily protein